MAKALSKVRVGMSQTLDDGSVDTEAEFIAVTDYLLIGNIVSSSGPSTTKPQVEHTDFESTGREYFGDLPEQGEFSLEINRNFGEAGQIQALTDASTPGTARPTQVEFLDPATNNVLETLYFIGEITGFPQTASQGEVYKGTVTIRISGGIFRV